MKVELCDWCGTYMDDNEGATLKIYERDEKQDEHKRLWGTTNIICPSCFKIVKNAMEGILT
jgi:hypothetical protein